MQDDVKPTVLVVDDTADNLSLMGSLLSRGYKVRVANSGEKALRIANSLPGPDLILLDIMMPEMDGYEVMRRLKSNAATHDIPVIFLTAKSEVADETFGLSLGAIDYITKPISPPIVLARIKTHLEVKRMQDFLRDKAGYLEAEVAKRTAQITALQSVTIHAMASLAETRDNETGAHIRRTQYYVKAMAQHLREHPRFAWFLNNDETIDLLFKSAPLHDIGKVGIPDNILLKPGKLTPEEFAVMKKHPTLGRDAIVHAEADLGFDMPFLRFAKDIAYGHHEKWDGSGYPQGLAGDDIPIAARLMAIADVYDALICKRVYKKPFTHEEAVGMIVDGKGKHFDPDVVDAFLAIQHEFIQIAARFVDEVD